MKIPLVPTLLFLAALVVFCLLAGCAHNQPIKKHDTAMLGSRIESATVGVQQAKRSTATISGSVDRARTASSRIDGKSTVVLKWLKEQP